MRLKDYLKTNGIKNNDFADYIGVSHVTISIIKHGRYIPSESLINLICMATLGKVTEQDLHDQHKEYLAKKEAKKEDLKFIIYPPDATEFRECTKCKNPFVFTGHRELCLWCELNLNNEESSKEKQ